MGQNRRPDVPDIGELAGRRAAVTLLRDMESSPTTGDLVELTRRVLAHRDERQWKQFHTPKELAISLTVEAAELLALMQWKTGDALDAALESKRVDVRDEWADCLHSLLLLADHMKIDLASALEEKLKKDALKYPIEKSRGRAEKYTDL